MNPLATRAIEYLNVLLLANAHGNPAISRFFHILSG